MERPYWRRSDPAYRNQLLLTTGLVFLATAPYLLLLVKVLLVTCLDRHFRGSNSQMSDCPLYWFCRLLNDLGEGGTVVGLFVYPWLLVELRKFVTPGLHRALLVLFVVGILLLAWQPSEYYHWNLNFS